MNWSCLSRHLAGIGLLLVGCSNTLGPDDIQPDPTAPVQTSALRYLAEDDGYALIVAVPLTYRNQTTHAVFFDRCGIWLEKLRDDRWTPIFAHACPGIGVSPLRIGPGDAYQTTFSMVHPWDTNTYPRFGRQPTSGAYRIVLQLYANTRPGVGFDLPIDSLPTAAGRSNAFWVDFP